MSHRMQRYAAAVLALALLAGLFLTFSFGKHTRADGPVAPTLSVSPGTMQTGGAAASGASVTVTGTGFVPAEAVKLTLGGQTLATKPSALLVANDSSFSGTFIVPSSLVVRNYLLVALGQNSGISASLPFLIKAPNENVYSPVSGNDTYHITDPDPREPSMYYLRITNNGDANLVNPKVLPDSVPGQDPVLDMSSLQSIINGVFAAHPNATTDAQKTFLLWQWLTNFIYHAYDSPSPKIADQVDAVGLLNNYGYSRCWNASRILSDLFQAAGYQARAWDLNGHAVAEVYYNNGWHMYDADEEKFFLGPDGSTVLGEQDLISNPHPIFQNTNPAGVALHYTAPYMANLYYTSGDNKPLDNVFPPPSHDMSLTLRKNETLMEYWKGIGKVHNTSGLSNPPVTSNGDFVYTPDLSQASYQNGVFNQTNVSAFSQDNLRPNVHAQTANTTSSLVYQVKSPYVLVGSLLSAQTYRATSNDMLSIYFSLDGTNWGSPIYTQSKLGYDNPTLDLSSYLNNGILPEEYQYYVMFQWTANSASNGAGLDSFSLDSQFQQAWEAIPPLHSGTTTISYTDQANSAHTAGTVQIAYGWKAQPALSDLGGSSLVADSTSIPANSNTFANVTLTLKTSSGAKVSGMVVQLVPNPGASVQIQRTYRSQGLRGQTDSSGQALFEVRSNQVGTVTLTASDKNGVSLGLAPVVLTFTSPGSYTMTSSQGSAVVNGGFETGDLQGWTPGGSVTPTVETSTVNSGTYAAQLGTPSPAGTPSDSSLVETLTVPAKVKSLNLAYWMTNPNADSNNYLEIWVRDTAADQVYRLFGSSMNSGAWTTLNLTYFNKYQGNTIQLYFNLHQDGSSNAAYAYLDNIQIK